MTLLLRDVEERWHQRHQDFCDDANLQIKATEARASVAETEAFAAVQRAEDCRDATIREATRRVEDAEKRAEIAEQRSERERERAAQAQRRYDELLVVERAAAEERCAEMERRCLQIQDESDRRVVEMQKRLTDAQRKAEKAQVDATARIQEAQKAADLQILEAKATKWRAVEAVKAQCGAQTRDIIDVTTRVQVEAQQRIEQVQVQSNARVEVERLRAQTNARAVSGGFQDGCACGTTFTLDSSFCRKCGRVKPGAQPLLTTVSQSCTRKEGSKLLPSLRPSQEGTKLLPSLRPSQPST